MLAMMLSLAMVAPGVEAPADAKMVDLEGPYTRWETASYTIEVPDGWKLTPETPWGQRKASPDGTGGNLGMMTAPPSNSSWERLYQTSLYFVTRERGGEPTPYEIVKTPQGYEAMSFAVLNREGFAERRYMMLRSETSGLLALSVDIPNPEAETDWQKHFEHMIKTASFASEA